MTPVGPLLFDMLGIVRISTKVLGQPPAKDRPFTLRRGGTVRDLAQMIHRGRAAELKFARVWGSGKFDGGRSAPVTGSGTAISSSCTGSSLLRITEADPLGSEGD